MRPAVLPNGPICPRCRHSQPAQICFECRCAYCDRFVSLEKTWTKTGELPQCWVCRGSLNLLLVAAIVVVVFAFVMGVLEST